MLRGRLDDRHEGLFLLDTGAGSSILNAAHLPRLGLDPEGVLRAIGAGGEAEGALVAVESLRLGRMELPAQSWVSLDLSAMEPWLGGEVLGVLGYDTLSLAVVEIDYDRGWVRFHPAASFRPPRGSVPVPVRLDQNIPTVEVEIEGRRAWVHLDTGSDNHLDLTAPYVRREGLLVDRGGLTETGTLGLGGRAPALQGRLAEFELAGFRFEDLPVNFNQAEEGVFANREIAGVLGAGVLRAFHLALDYSRRTLWLSPGAHAPGS
jgi:hypothetical protein